MHQTAAPCFTSSPAPVAQTQTLCTGSVWCPRTDSRVRARAGVRGARLDVLHGPGVVPPDRQHGPRAGQRPRRAPGCPGRAWCGAPGQQARPTRVKAPAARAWMFWMGPKWKKMAVRWYSLACGGRLPTYSVATGLAGWPASPSPAPSPASAPSRSAPSASASSGAAPSHGEGLDTGAPPAARASSGLLSGAPPPGDAGTLAPVLPPSRPFSRTGAHAPHNAVTARFAPLGKP
jgi:hypothetical protein